MPDLRGEGSGANATLTAPRRLAAVDYARRRLTDLRAVLSGCAKLVARAVGAPVCVLSIVGADQVYAVDRYAVPPSRWDAGEVPLTYAFCGEVIIRRATVVLPDVLADPGTRDLPVVRDTGVRAYLGVPLSGPGGELIGVLGLGDFTVRSWSAGEIALAEVASRLISEAIAGRPAGVSSGAHVALDATASALEAGLDEAIKARHAAERDLLNTRDLLQALLDSVEGSVLMLDSAGRVVPNESMRSLGMPASWTMDDLSRSLPYLFHPDGRPMTAAEIPLKRVLAGEALHDSEIVVRYPGRRERVLSASGRPVGDQAGRRLGVVVVVNDITERRRTERFQACDLSVTRILAGSGTLAQVSEAVLERVGEAVGAAGVELWLTDQVGGDSRLTAAWGAPGAADTGPAGGGRTDGGEFGADGPVVFSVPLVEDGETFGTLVLRGHPADATEQEFLEGIAIELGHFVTRRRAEELTLELARTKDEFIALAGHTLRTPLTTIVSLTELLLAAGDDLADEREQLLDRVRANADALRGIVEDLLVLAGLESGHINLSIAPLDLSELVRGAIADVAAGAASVGVRMVADLPADLPAVGDRVRLRQAVDNLLSNAVKYSPGGGTVRVTLTAAQAVADLTVADEGLGIPDADRDRLFQRFFRGSAAHERGIPGTGLGLPLTRLITELHGGTIALHVGGGRVGTTVTLRLPLTGPGA